MHKIEMNNWSRKSVYELYSQYSNPFYMVSFNVDVTNLYKYVKTHKLSFYYSMVYFCTKAINAVENFRYVKRENEILLIEERLPSFTTMPKNSENYHILTMYMEKDVNTFCMKTEEKDRTQKEFIDLNMENKDLIYFSCLPWIELTSMTNVRNYNDPSSVTSNIPSISWGKFKEEGEKKILTICVEVNHCYIDGYHIGKFAQNLENEFKNLNS